MQQIEDNAITSGSVDEDGHLILVRNNGEQVDAGFVRGTLGGAIYIQPDEPEGVEGEAVFVDTDDFYYEFPVGGILPYASTIPPDGFLVCDGGEIEREAYPKLFDVIGTDWGEGDGSTTFNVPDLVDQSIQVTGQTESVGYIIRAL